MTTKMAMSAKYCALLGVSLLPIIGIGSVARAQAASETELNEVIVTATRQSERLSRVPISVAAFTPETMDKFGVKQVDDLVRLTPGLSMSRSVTGANTISIRGISSAAGAGVTGVYIDDTPIQVRNQGYGSGTAFPEVFDLERIEVLRGPQGTLFGAGSEGGTVRFIQAKPVMTGYSAYARAEVAHTERGDWTYEGGVAVGGAIVEDKIGFRGNVYYRREGGYVDGVEGVARLALNPANPAQPPAAIFPNGNLVDFTRTATVRPDTNRNEAFTARLAVEIRPTEQLTLTPSVSYQKLRANDGTGGFWTSTSDISRRDYSRLVYTRGDPATNPALTPIDISDEDEGREQPKRPALSVLVDIDDKAARRKIAVKGLREAVPAEVIAQHLKDCPRLAGSPDHFSQRLAVVVVPKLPINERTQLLVPLVVEPSERPKPQLHPKVGEQEVVIDPPIPCRLGDVAAVPPLRVYHSREPPVLGLSELFSFCLDVGEPGEHTTPDLSDVKVVPRKDCGPDVVGHVNLRLQAVLPVASLTNGGAASAPSASPSSAAPSTRQLSS